MCGCNLHQALLVQGGGESLYVPVFAAAGKIQRKASGSDTALPHFKSAGEDVSHATANSRDRHPRGTWCFVRRCGAAGADAGSAAHSRGLILGLALAFGLTRFIAGLLYGVSANDPVPGDRCCCAAWGNVAAGKLSACAAGDVRGPSVCDSRALAKSPGSRPKTQIRGLFSSESESSFYMPPPRLAGGTMLFMRR
jgi:hypothetical protein